MKKQDTAAFSLIRCDTEKKMPALAVRAIRAALFFAGLLAVAQGAAGIWTNYGWLWAAAGAAALVWQSVALGLPRRWLRAVLPLLCLVCAAVFSGRFLAGAVTVSSAACETLTKATGHILLPLAGAGADVALFVGILAALLGTLCAYAVRWSPTGCGLLLTVLSAALLALLRPRCWQRQACLQLHCWPYRDCEAAHCFPSGERLPAPHCTGSGTNPGRLCCRKGSFPTIPPHRSRHHA